MITVKLLFKSHEIRVERKASFQRRGRTPEKVATDWIKDIKKEMEIEELLKVEADGIDITDKLTEYLSKE